MFFILTFSFGIFLPSNKFCLAFSGIQRGKRAEPGFHYNLSVFIITADKSEKKQTELYQKRKHISLT